MGARQTKRSVDISTTPKKEKEGVVEEKLEKIEEQDLAKVQNGTAHTENQEGGGDGDTAIVNGGGGGEEKVEENKEEKEEKEKEATPEEKKEPTPAGTPDQEKQPQPEEKSDKKKKEKSKKKWSFRSISFSKKDKSKPNMSREDSKTGDLAKEATVPEVAEGGENQEKTPSETTPKTEEAVSPISNDEIKTAVVVATEEVPAAITAVTTAASTTVQEITTSNTSSNEQKKEEVKEETNISNVSEQEILEKIVETSSTVITKVTESSSVTITSTQHVQEVVEMKSEESIVPPLPASPPPTEAPPPTPVAPQQPEHEEVNGGGESMAELPEENGLGPDAKLEDDDEIVPKVNGHHDDSPVKQVVDSIIDTIKTPEPTEKITVTENIVEVTTKETAAVEE